MIDSHCHLDLDQFDVDREQVIAAARDLGVQGFINPSTNLASSQRALILAESQPDLYVAVGYHPYEAAGVNDETLAGLQDLAAHPKVVSIGEIGLDYYRDHAPKAVQHRAFEQQLDLAKRCQFPVIIHQRAAAGDTMAILRQWGAGGEHPGLVLHAFSGDQAMLDEAFDLGFYIGIGGPITFKNARGLPDLVAQIPLNRLLLETDSPYLSPHPHRGKRNEPAHLSLIAAKIAQIFGLDEATLRQQTQTNTQQLFSLINCYQ